MSTYKKGQNPEWEKLVNEWAVSHPDLVFEQLPIYRAVLTPETWNIITANKSIDWADKMYKAGKLPDNVYLKFFNASVDLNRNEAGKKIGALTAAATAPIAAPLIAEAAPYVTNVVAKAGYKYVPKAAHYLNYLFPGTSEFMLIYNAGKAGKVVATGLTALEAANEAGALDRFIKNPSVTTGAEAAVATAPVVGSSISAALRGSIQLARTYKPIRDFKIGLEFGKLNLVNEITRLGNLIKGKVRLAKNYINADKRITNLISEAGDRMGRYSDLKHETEYKLSDNTRNKQTLKHMFNDPETENRLLVKAMQLAYPQYKYYSSFGLGDFSSQTKKELRMRYRGSSSSFPRKADFSKMSIDEFEKLIYKRADARKIEPYKSFEEWKSQFRLKLLEHGVKIIKTNDGFVIEKKHQSSDLYDPSKYVTTHYKINDFTDLEKAPLIGDILFAPVGSEITTDQFIFGKNFKTNRISQQNNVGSSNLIHLDQNYISRLSRNINTVKELIPGFKPFGSSVGVAEAKFPHATHDIDGYMLENDFNTWYNLNKNKYKIDQISSDTYKVHLFPKLGEEGDIDINILRGDQLGFITGERAYEMARQYFPDEFSDAIFNSYNSNTPFLIKITPRKLFDLFDPVIKTIADSFEIDPSIPGKEKLAGRPLIYLSSADPLLIAKALDLMARSHGATNKFPVNISELSNPELNKLILKELNIPVSEQEVISDPRKMKNLLDYWYLNHSIRGRGIELVKNLDIYNAMFNWNSESLGGNTYGAGLNTVTLGDSRHGPLYGFFLLNPQIDENLSVLEKIKLILKKLGMPEYVYSESDITKINELAKKYGFDIRNLSNSESILDQIPTRGENSKLFLQDLYNELGIESLTRSDTYNSGRYSSITRSLPRDTKVIFTNNYDKKLKSGIVNIEKRKLLLRGSIDSSELDFEEISRNLEDLYINAGVHPSFETNELDLPVSISFKSGDYNKLKEFIEKVSLKSRGKLDEYTREFNRLKEERNELISELNKYKELEIISGELFDKLFDKYSSISAKISTLKDNLKTYTFEIGIPGLGVGLLGYKFASDYIKTKNAEKEFLKNASDYSDEELNEFARFRLTRNVARKYLRDNGYTYDFNLHKYVKLSNVKLHKTGGSIHIKKENRGKFTDYCGGKVTSECIARGKNSPSATIRKRATFAANARKWKHLTGGEIWFNAVKNRFKNIFKASDPRKESKDSKPEETKIQSEQTTNWIQNWKERLIGQSISLNDEERALEILSDYTKAKQRDYIFNKLKSLGLDDDIALALTAQAGGESTYDHRAHNDIAGGLGGWIKSFDVQKDVLDWINRNYNKTYTDLLETDLDEQIAALKWYYYDRNKDLVDKVKGSYNKALLFSQLGFSPTIVRNGQVTWRGKTYYNTPESWTEYMNDTGNNPGGKHKTYLDHFLNRLKYSGFA